jgi:uncharacterized protein DUF1538
MSETLMLNELHATASSVATAVLPLAVLFIAFQLLLLKLPSKDVRNILMGTLLSAAGLFLFLLGVSIGFLPFGRAIGEALGSLSQPWLLLPVGLFLGFVTTWGEPAVRIFADQVEDASNGSIRRSMILYAICAGVALWVGLGLLRISYGIPILYLLVPGYLFVIAIMWFSGKEFVSIAVDAGGVATGPMANTFLLALALGASASMGDQDPIIHGLGLVSLIALAPILSVMTLGLLVRRKEHRKER